MLHVINLTCEEGQDIWVTATWDMPYSSYLVFLFIIMIQVFTQPKLCGIERFGIKKKQTKSRIKWRKISSCYLLRINVLAKFENQKVVNDFVTNLFRFHNKLGALLQKKKLPKSLFYFKVHSKKRNKIVDIVPKGIDVQM